MPKPSPSVHVPVDCPPITGSFKILKVKDVSPAPSNVTNVPGVEAWSAVDVALMESICKLKSPSTPSAQTSKALIVFKNCGTSTTSPSKMPKPSPSVHVPVDCPPITGSFKILK